MIVFHPDALDDTVIGCPIIVFTDEFQEIDAVLFKGTLTHDGPTECLKNGYFFVLQDGRAMCFYDSDRVYIDA
jgi:hypothetical protein